MAWELLCLKRKITEQTRRERNNVFSNIRKNITKLRKLKLLLVKSIDVSEMCVVIKLKFHGTDTDTDTDFLADFRARLARKSACRGPRGPFSSPTCPRTFVRRSLFLARMSVWDARVYTYVYCT